MARNDSLSEPAMEIQRYLAILHRRKSLIGTSLLLSLLVATLYNYTAGPLYRSTAQIMISKNTPAILPTRRSTSVLEMSDLTTQIQLLRSRSLAERVVEKLELQKAREFQSGPLMSPWERFRRKFLGWKPPAMLDSEGLPMPPTVAAFRSRVHVKVVSGSRLVNLGFTAYDPRLARDAANGLSQLFIEWSLENRVAASKDATGWLSNQLREQQARIRTAERNLQEYQVESGLGNFEERLEMTEQELATLSAAVTQAHMGRVEKETLVTQLRGTSTTDMAAFPLVQSDPVVRDHREALSALRDERRRLSRELGHKHPRMIELASQIDTGEARLNTAIRDTSERLASQAETGRQQETELRQQLVARKYETSSTCFRISYMGYGRVYVAPPERRELERRLRSRSGRIEDARRARVILLLAAGHSYREICTELRCSHEYIARWKTRFQEDRLGGLDSRHVGRQAWVVTPKLEARVLNRTRQPPSDGSTHWSSRKLAKEFRISHVTVTQIWKRAGLKPHRIKRYMASNDPDFETKAADIIGLYLKPPKHAAIFSLDEKTAIQALDRLDPVLPLSPGRLERHGFEYYRHGTLSLYAALDTLSGEVYGKTATRHTSAEFVKFMEELVDRQPRRREIHVILDNLSAHKTAKVRAFLEAHPKVHLHFTPTYSSWLNQVENWFSKIERDVIARGVFSSTGDLRKKLMRYIRRYNRNARPIRWAYSDPSRRIKAASRSSLTGH